VLTAGYDGDDNVLEMSLGNIAPKRGKGIEQAFGVHQRRIMMALAYLMFLGATMMVYCEDSGLPRLCGLT